MDGLRMKIIPIVPFHCWHCSKDMLNEDYSVILKYLGLLIISCLLIYETYVNTTLALTMILVIAVIIEILMIFVIPR